MSKDLLDPKEVDFDRLLLDPNNPRIAPNNAPGYDNPAAIRALQGELTDTVYEVYKAAALEAAIRAQGWVPIDAILVWELPNAPGWYVVVEGNTRTSILRRIRQDLQRKRVKLAKVESATRAYAPHEGVGLQREIAKLEEIVQSTDTLTVYPVNAATAEDLVAVLPRLLGVRHIMHAKHWSPYAQNLYLFSLYYRLFQEKYPGEDLRLEKDLLKQVGDAVSLSDREARRNIQAAAAFSHFKLSYEDHLPKEGKGFTDEDQYFFVQILENTYPRQQFEFTEDKLALDEEMEKVLFHWAFERPRPERGKNPNRFTRAEDMRLWQSMKRYDDKHNTTFAQRFNVENPTTAPRINTVQADFLSHKAKMTPLDNIQRLIEAFRKLEFGVVDLQGEQLAPMLKEVQRIATRYLRSINDGHEPDDSATDQAAD